MTAPENKVMVQGQTVASADYLNSLVEWVPDLNTLRTFIGTSSMTVVLLGFQTINDGGQGTYTWNDNSTAPDDGHTIVVPQGVSQGAWIRTALNPPLIQLPTGGTVNGKCGGVYLALGTLTLNLPLSTTLAVTCTMQVFAYGGPVTLVRTGNDLINGAAASLVVPKGYASTIYTDANGNFYATLQPSVLAVNTTISVPPGGVSVYPGNPNNIVVNTGGAFKGIPGQFFFFTATNTTTGPTALDAGTGLIQVVANTPSGLSGSIGGEIVAGDYYLVAYNGTFWVLINPTLIPATILQQSPSQIASFRSHQASGFKEPLNANGTAKVIPMPRLLLELPSAGAHYNTSLSRWTPPAGMILLHGQLDFPSTADGAAAIQIYKNGNVAVQTLRHISTDAQGLSSLQITWIDLASGADYYQLGASSPIPGAYVTCGGGSSGWFFGTML